MTIKQTKTWREYKRLLRNYRIMCESLSWAGTKPPEEAQQLQVDFHTTQKKLDAFVMTHIAIRAIAKGIAVK